jgi:hypothetical protein
MSNLHYEIQLMAHEMGDDWGEDIETIVCIAEHLHVSTEVVAEVLRSERDEDYDGQPDELTEWMDFDPDC